MKIIFLGTNGWFNTKTANTVCSLIETDKFYLILDAGGGLYKIENFIKKEKPIYLFLSHYHLDHIEGLHILARFKFPQGLEIYGPVGLEKMFSQVIARPYSAPLDSLFTSVRLHELGHGEPPSFVVKCLKLQHSVPCYGYRFFLDGKIISYTTDTGPCRNLLVLEDRAALAICECSFLSGMRPDSWGHLTPEEAARAGLKARVKKLALIHFDAALYRTLAERKRAEKKAREIFKDTFAAEDDFRISL